MDGAYTAQRSYSLQREDLYIHPVEPGTIDFILLERNTTCFFRVFLFRIVSEEVFGTTGQYDAGLNGRMRQGKAMQLTCLWLSPVLLVSVLT
jgi:hypothetical protein